VATKGKKAIPAPVPVRPSQRGFLEIEFSGLCALVLNARDPKKATEARVLLVAADRVLKFSKKQMQSEGRRWSARLCVPSANVADATAADEILETYGGDQLAVWRLDGPSTLTIDNASADPLVVASGDRKRHGLLWKSAMPSSQEPPEDISWLPDMERIVPGAGKLKSGLWDGWGGSSGPLSGKVIVKSGRIEAIQPSSQEYVFQDDHRNRKTDYQQCFANGIRVRVWLEERKAKLRLTGPDRIIELRENPEYEPIRASITNHSGSSSDDHTMDGDPHFKAFYALSQQGHKLKEPDRFFPAGTGGVIHSKLRPCMGIVLDDE